MLSTDARANGLAVLTRLALNNWSLRLEGAGRVEDALTAIEGAVVLRAASWRTRMRPICQRSLSPLSNCNSMR
jgi:hypothetical protein